MRVGLQTGQIITSKPPPPPEDVSEVKIPSPRSTDSFEELRNPLSPPRGGRCHGVTEGGSADNEQIGLLNSEPPSAPGSSPGQAFGISPARREKGSISKVSMRRGLEMRFDVMGCVRGSRGRGQIRRADRR